MARQTDKGLIVLRLFRKDGKGAFLVMSFCIKANRPRLPPTGDGLFCHVQRNPQTKSNSAKLSISPFSREMLGKRVTDELQVPSSVIPKAAGWCACEIPARLNCWNTGRPAGGAV